MFISKRIMIITSIVVAIVMLAAGVSLVYAFTALGQQTTANANLNATATAAVIAVPSPKPGPRRVIGVVQSLGTSSFTMAVQRDKKTVTITVNVNTSTKYTHAGKAAAFSDLQVGQTVAVMGTVDIKALTVQATRVVISPPPAKPTATPTVSPTATATP